MKKCIFALYKSGTVFSVLKDVTLMSTPGASFTKLPTLITQYAFAYAKLLYLSIYLDVINVRFNNYIHFYHIDAKL